MKPDAIKDAAILIVDDNHANVELLRQMLAYDGYRDVHGETDPRKALALCEARVFDLLLLDVRMPHISGFELMERLRAIYADDYVPVLMLTAQTDPEIRRKALEMGANDFLTKPFIVWELLHRVRNTLEVRTLYRHIAAQNQALEHRVTERTKELSEALVAARQADRAKLDFLSVISHELRTPLNSIIGFAEVMATESFGPLGHPDYRDFVTLIEENGAALLSTVNQILDYTRGSTGSVERRESDVPLPALLTQCLTLFAPKAQAKGIALTLTPPTPTLILRADRRRLRDMLLNLLNNAIKFTPSGGHVTLSAETAADGVLLRVSDDGPGIAANRRERIFDPFTQAEDVLTRQHEGIGLGLSIVRRFAEAHDGRVALDSTLGKGTTVTIWLPRERVVSLPAL